MSKEIDELVERVADKIWNARGYANEADMLRCRNLAKQILSDPALYVKVEIEGDAWDVSSAEMGCSIREKSYEYVPLSSVLEK